jgi:hypothetical protein
MMMMMMMIMMVDVCVWHGEQGAFTCDDVRMLMRGVDVDLDRDVDAPIAGARGLE